MSSGKGWEQTLWPLLVRIVRGEKVPRLRRVLMGLEPGKQMSPNHTMMARAVGIEWMRRWDHPVSPDLQRLEKIVEDEGKNQLEHGIWTMGKTCEQFCPDPHAAYWILPALCFVQHEPIKKVWQEWWRGTITAWQAGASIHGEVLLPCGRWAGRFSQVTDACYRNLFNLSHRNNKFQIVSWKNWAGRFEPLSGFAAAVEFERVLRATTDPFDFNTHQVKVNRMPQLALPIAVKRNRNGMEAGMYQRNGISIFGPCWSVKAEWREDQPTKYTVDLKQEAGIVNKGGRLELRREA